MNIHEYQGKQLLKRYGVPVRPGKVAFTVDEAVSAAESMEAGLYVVKAQIHAGGRGKGGGVKLARSIDEVRTHASNILGMQLVTHQTGPQGQKVQRVYIENGVDIARELYVGMTLDRERSQVALMASTEGGVDIEEVAEHSPEKIFKEWIDPGVGLTSFQATRVAYKLGFSGRTARAVSKLLGGLYTCFMDNDCSIVEINPFVETPTGEVYALDAKINFDDNALYRHKDIYELRDIDEEDPLEVRAKAFDLSYVKLDGNVGCMVNGAGLAMATMDILKHVGVEPANFLDVGGGATEDKVTEAFKILVDDGVDAIFVNIFGGIMKCDIIANGVVAAAKAVGLNVPLIVRLEGTNVELGKKILAESGLTITSADSMLDGAQKAATAVRG